MKPSLQVRLSQHLALTPQLQQSIRLLQLSTLELHQEVEQMLEINPFLEVDDAADVVEAAMPDWSGSTRTESAGTGDEPGSAGDSEGEPSGLDGIQSGVTARDDWENGTEADDFDGIADAPSLRTGAASEDGDADWSERSSSDATLADALRVQLRGMRLQPLDAWMVEALIDSLDDDGYLADSLDEIADRLLDELASVSSREMADPEPGEDTPTAREELLSRLRCALGWLQSLEPTGVGARNLSECLVLQLRESSADPEVCDLAQRICRDHLELLARRDWRKLMAQTGAHEEALRLAHALIQTLEPKPGRAFAPAEANIIVPDVIVQKSGRGWRVLLNPDVMPKLRINDLYAQAMRQNRGRTSADETGGLSGRLQEARWFVKNILQRFETIQRVSQAIVEHQKGFLSHGEIGMKPLVLREIADELGLHESTISRVTTAKYMATPFGTFELKYFFGSSLNTEAGGNASSTAVRALIRQFVAAEDPRKPLSDSQLSTMLEEQGIQVARRTVAKYREALKIAPASTRKAL